jgi:hypothetical protein
MFFLHQLIGSYKLSSFLRVWEGLTESYYVVKPGLKLHLAKADLDLESSCLCPPSAGITGMHYNTWLIFLLYPIDLVDYTG